MDKQQARNLIKESFENPFDKDRFTLFIKNLLNRIEEAPFTYQGQYIPEAYRQYIRTLERIGKFNDGENRIDILVIKLQKETSLERARTMQRNFVAWYLNGSRGGELKDAALAAFVSPNEEDWRFSLVKMDYRFEEGKGGRVKVKEEFTPARRWSFLVGANENSHTAQSKLYPIIADDEHDPALAELEEAFNIEKVTKEFFEKYRDLFLWTKEILDEVVSGDKKIKAEFENKGINTVDFAKKLLGQIVFLYFLQKKGWFGVGRDAEWGTGSKHFLRELFKKKHSDYKNFFNDILEPLFYEALRVGEERKQDDYYYSRFNCKIPFLNGGLFDPINGYDWVKTDILLPNELFSNSFKTKEGDTGNGILDIFDRYNFTVKEDEPLEKEVAVDPEMLGKVFENLLEVKDRKSKGTYYTPREIVHYMCQQSLIYYLYSALNEDMNSVMAENFPSSVIPARRESFLKKDAGQAGMTEQLKEDESVKKISREDIEMLIKYGEQLGENEATVEARGKETKTYFYKLPESIRQNAELIDNKLEDIAVCDPAIGSGAFPVGMMAEIVKTRNVLSAFIKDQHRTIYNFKRECIERSLYGVDIDPGAVEIAKLRLWLSLVVDEDDIKNIKPLPNLDYKIVCGNSLLGVEKNLFNSDLFNELERLKPLYFNETNPTKKQEYKNRIDELIGKITKGHKEFDFEVYFSEVFHHKGGFDVVIANPPYVEHKKLKGISSELKKCYSTYSGTADLYVYFYEKGIKNLRDNGALVYITSNKFIKTSYGEKLRQYFTTFNINEIIDFTDVHVFEALVASCIVVISKNKNLDNKVKIVYVNDILVDFPDLNAFVDRNRFFLKQSNLSEKIWQLDNETNLSLKEKIEAGSVRMSEMGTINIYRGVTTGYNSAFIIDDEKRKELIKEDKANKDIIKPLLQGRNIKKWIFESNNENLLFVPWHFPLHNDASISGASEKAEKKLKTEYSSLYKHLQKFKNELSERNKEETGIRYEWYSLQRCAASYYPEFEKEKIIWGLTADKWAFAYDNENHFLPSNGYILTSKTIPIKYLLALMNSKLMEFYFGFIGIMTAGGAFTLKYETVIEFPIKIIPESAQQPFITLVDQILTAKKKDPNADTSALEREIDKMVYELYGLTPEEIEIVEGK